MPGNPAVGFQDFGNSKTLIQGLAHGWGSMQGKDSAFAKYKNTESVIQIGVGNQNAFNGSAADFSWRRQ